MSITDCVSSRFIPLPECPYLLEGKGKACFTDPETLSFRIGSQKAPRLFTTLWMERLDQHGNYRRWLLEEMTARQQRNPSLSLRSFAGKLGISPPQLSGLLSGKRRLTPKIARQIADRLNLSPREKWALVRSLKKEASPEAPDEEYEVMQMDTFRMISDWFHYAILSLSEVQDAKADPKWIAQRLGILQREAEEAFDRLKRLKLVEEKDGRYRQIAPPLASEDSLASPAIRKYLSQFLHKAEEALDRHPQELLNYHTVVMAADPKNLEEAKKKMKKFRRSLSESMEQGKRTRVYALSMQLFPVDQNV